MEFGTWTSVLLILNLILYFILFSRRKRKHGEPPIVHHSIPIIGGTLEFGKSPLKYLGGLRKKYGDVFTVHMAGWEVHFFTNPDDIKSLEKAKDLKQDQVLYDFATRVIGTPHAIDAAGEFNPRGPEVMHAIAKTMRGSSSLTKLTEACIVSTTHAFENTIRTDQRFIEGKPVQLYELVGKILYDVTFYMFFGYPTTAEERKAEKEMFYDDFMTYFKGSALLVDRVSINLLPTIKKVRARLLRKLGTIKLDNRVGVSDLISSVADISKEKENEDERLRHLLILFWSAQANSRPALFWVMFHLIQRPDVVTKIMQEYDDLIKLRDRSRVKRQNNPGAESMLSHWLGISEISCIERKDLDKLVILDSCVKETLRLTGSSMAMRRAKKDTSIRVCNGRQYRIRKGDFSAVFSQVTHMNEDVHERPTEYIYDRFLVDCNQGSSENGRRSSESDTSELSNECLDDTNSIGTRKAKTRFGKPGNKISASRALLTFGYGINRCPGRHIALIEIKLCVILFCRYFNLALVNKDEETPPYNMRHLGFGVMPPARDVEIHLSAKHVTT